MRFGPRRQLQPDLAVLPKNRTLVDRIPLLVVEVLSPSTTAIDRTLKRHVFEQGGVASYWLLDPLEPSLTVLELRDGAYVEVAHATGRQPVEVALPFPLRMVPAALLD